MELTIIHIDISPGKEKKCCQNRNCFTKYGVHLGYCILKNTEKMDIQKCKDFEKDNDIRID